MAIICRKKVQLSWNSDQLCISMCFIKFQMIFEKFRKLADFRPKNVDFFRFLRCDFGPPFSPEKNWSQRGMVRMSWFLVMCMSLLCNVQYCSWQVTRCPWWPLRASQRVVEFYDHSFEIMVPYLLSLTPDRRRPLMTSPYWYLLAPLHSVPYWSLLAPLSHVIYCFEASPIT